MAGAIDLRIEGGNQAGAIIGAQIGSVVINNAGPTAEQIAAAVVASMRAAGQVPGEDGPDRTTIIALAQRLAPETLSFAQAVREVEAAVGVALTARDQARAAPEDGVLAAVQQTGPDLDAGARLLDGALAELEQEEQAAALALRERRRRLLDAAASQDWLRRDASGVAARYEALIALDYGGERIPFMPAFIQRFETLLQDGIASGLNFPLRVSIALARRMAATAVDGQERRIAALALGGALTTLGERESGTEHLDEGLQIMAAAPKPSPDDAPLLTGSTQLFLAMGYLAIGTRDGSVPALERACTAASAAVDNLGGDRDMLGPAEIVHGTVLTVLGERTGSIDMLRDAVTWLQGGLSRLDDALDPTNVARGRSALGTALLFIGLQAPGGPELTEAAAHLRAATAAFEQGALPADHARACLFLGLALGQIAARDNSPARAREAREVAALACALYSAEDQPVNHARARVCHACATMTLGRLTGSARLLRQAVGEFRDGLLGTPPDSQPRVWAGGQAELAATLEVLGLLRRSIPLLQEAIAVCDATLAVVTPLGDEHLLSLLTTRRQGVQAQLAELQSRPHVSVRR